MMLWDIIRNWFVMNVWGGWTSDGHSYSSVIGTLELYVDGEFDDNWPASLNELWFHVGDKGNSSTYIAMSDWLSTTSTIIVLVCVCVALFFLVRYFFRMFAGLLSGR